jgi:hypothetical protein
MCKRIVFVALLTGLVVTLPDGARGQDQKKKGKDNVEQATAQDYEKLNTMRDAIALFTRVETNDDKTGKSLVLKLPYQIPDPKNAQNLAGQNARLQSLLAQQQQALTIQNPKQQLRKVQQLQTQINRLQQQILTKTKFQTKYKEIELLPTDKFEVRWQKPKVEFDNKGNVKEYTQEELKKLKGNDPNKVGYAGVLEDLADGQYVKLYLVSTKKPATSSGSKDTDLADADPFAGRPRISMVLITADTNTQALTSTPGKDKK